MKMNNLNDRCVLRGDILAYLYDELSPAGRSGFETHLEDCSSCISELAELSDARYSVFEWKKMEFTPLATPRFVIPRERAKASWLDSIKTAFAGRGIALAGGLAAIVIFAVIGLMVVSRSSDHLSVTPDEIKILSGTNTNASLSDEVVSASNHPELVATGEPIPVFKPRVSIPPRVEASVKARQVRKVPARTISTTETVSNQRLRNSPTLGQYAEDRDESLRLADLFDDLDTRELE